MAVPAVTVTDAELQHDIARHRAGKAAHLDPATKLMAGARLFDIARNRMLTGIWSRHPDWPAFSPSFAVKPSDQKFSGRPAAYELFDLIADPQEQHNLLFDAAEAESPQVAAVFPGGRRWVKKPSPKR